jgi:dihydroorotate dehydrogenase
VGTAIRSKGPWVFQTIAEELLEWLEARGHSSLSEVRGILVGGDHR